MKGRQLFVLSVILLSSLLLTDCNGASWGTSVNDFVPTSLAVGFQNHAVWSDKGPTFGAVGKDILDKLASEDGMNGQVLRIDISWANFETSRGKFVARPYGGKMEDTLTYIRGLGKKALITLNESPVFTHPGFTASTKALPDDPMEYTRIGKWFHEYLAPWNDVLVGVEIFNEGNLAGDGGFDRAVTTPRPAHYVDCLIAYYNAAKASNNPYLPVVFGAPESIAVDPTKDAVNAKFNWIGMAYDHLRLNRASQRPWDVMAVHVYPTNHRYPATEDWASFFVHMKALKARMTREGDPSPIYITESGHSAHNNTKTTKPWFTGVTESEQGSYTAEDIRGVYRDYPNVKVFIVYNDVMKGNPNTATVERDIHEHGFGILRFQTRATTKPIYTDLRNVISSLPYPYASAVGTVVKAGSNDTIIDSANNKWSISSNKKVLINEAVETITYYVQKLYYGNGKIWQQNRDNMWWYKTSPSSAWSPSAGTAQGPGFVGCFKDSSSARDLNSYSTSSSSMTVETCITTCSARGYKYAGAQFAKECYCGNSYGSKGTAPVSECSTACSGDSTEKCGGGSRNSVFDTTLA